MFTHKTTLAGGLLQNMHHLQPFDATSSCLALFWPSIIKEEHRVNLMQLFIANKYPY
jgi:hypothetical protein